MLASRKNELERDLSVWNQKITRSLATFLGRVLPTIPNYSWKQNVVQYQSVSNSRIIEQQGKDTFEALDLAMLLQAFESNWTALSKKQSLKLEEKNIVKEMKAVRIRWAHVTGQVTPPEDEFRDFVTLLHFAQLIKTEDTLLKELRTDMLDLLPKIEASLRQGGVITPPIQAPVPLNISSGSTKKGKKRRVDPKQGNLF